MDAQYSYFFRLSSILEAMPDALVIINHLGRIILINGQTEKLFGYERAELLGNLVEQLIPTRFRDKHLQHRIDYYSAPSIRPMGSGLELFGLHKNGQEFPIELSLSPLKTEEGTLVVAALRDVTDRKIIEEKIREHNIELQAANLQLEKINSQAQETNQLKNQFLANMSHELRTPLNGIIGFSELMFHEKLGPISSEYKEFLSDILSSSHHLLQLINDVLDLAKIESGKIEFYPENIQLKKLIIEVVDILRTLLAKKRIQLKIDVNPTLNVFIDPAKFKQVLYNYISNAIKFTHEEGQVTIRISPEIQDHFRLEVIDTGIGIKKEDIEKLFVEFQQLNSRSNKNYQGTGLGLALTKRIIESQGGKVGVTSAPGKGSTFFAVLPCQFKSNDHLIKTSKTYHSSIHIENAPNILVIDDESHDRIAMVKGLSEEGYVVNIAVNGKEAIELCHRHHYHAIILDLLLPDISGWDVLRTIRSQGLNTHTPIITVSIVKEKASSIGYALHDFLIKPVDIKQLITSLKSAGVAPGIQTENHLKEKLA